MPQAGWVGFSQFSSSVILVAAAEPLGSDLLLLQEREFLTELEVCIISDVYFSSEVKRGLFLSTHTLGVLVFVGFFSRWQTKVIPA